MLPNESRLEDLEFDLWREMKSFSVEQLCAELHGSDAMRQFAAAKQLQLRGASREVFSSILTLLKDENNSRRKVAAFCLGQLGTPERPFAGETVPLLIEMVSKDLDSDVRAEAMTALGHLGDMRSIECLTHAAHEQDKGIRISVAFALGHIQDERCVDPLLMLTHDPDTEVVSWAVLGLRHLDFATPAVRNRLVDLLACQDEELSEEVICALADWYDVRVLPALTDKLRQDDIRIELFDAAGKLGDKNLLPRLNALLDDWGSDAPPALQQAVVKLAAL